MRLSEEQIGEITEAIRQELVERPAITILELKARLFRRFQHSYDKNFICNLKNKIHSERALQIKNITINTKLAEYEDAIRLIRTYLWKIIDNKKYSVRTRIRAIREVRQAHGAWIDALLNSGLTGVYPIKRPRKRRKIRKNHFGQRVKIW